MKYWTHLAEWRVPVRQAWEPLYPIGLSLAGTVPPETPIRVCGVGPTRRHKHVFMNRDYHRFPRADLDVTAVSPSDGRPTVVREDGFLRLEIRESEAVEIDIERSSLRFPVKMWDMDNPGRTARRIECFDTADSVIHEPSEPISGTIEDVGAESTVTHTIEDAKDRYVEGESDILTLEDELETAMVEEDDELETEPEEGEEMDDDDDRTYTCNACDKTFTKLSVFKVHWKRFHE